MSQVMRIARAIAGFALILAGVAMLVLPGPGWVTIAVGLALLSRDFPWAERSLHRLKVAGRAVLTSTRDWLQKVGRRTSGNS